MYTIIHSFFKLLCFVLFFFDLGSFLLWEVVDNFNKLLTDFVILTD